MKQNHPKPPLESSKTKDSGIPYLGNIPEHWEVVKIKHIAYVNPKIRKADIDDSQTIDFIPMECINPDKGSVSKLETKFFSEVKKGYTAFNEEDIIFAKITPCMENGNCAIVPPLKFRFGFGSTEFIVIRASRFTATKFIYYFLRNKVFRNIAKNFMTGSEGRKRIYPDFISEFTLALPPLQEQEAIAGFLDKQCKKIDDAIGKQQKLISLLKEQKNSLIAECVSKGLNPTAKTKDSGIPYLGNIPEHWELIPLQRIFKERKENNNKETLDLILSLVKGRGVIPYNEKGDIGNKSKDDLSQYKIARKDDLVLNKMNAVIGSIGLSRFEGLVSPIYLVLTIRDHQKALPVYFSLMFSIKSLQESLSQYAYGIMKIRESIDFLEFKKMCLPLPPLQEQEAIAGFLDKQCKKIDDAIGKIQSQMHLLKEYKSSLINEATTGKLQIKSKVEENDQ